jgi:6-phosphogluconolactonase
VKRQPMLSVAIAAIAALTATHQGAARAEESLASVYTMSNAISGNRILAFHRAPDGTLTAGGSFATGGLGTGGGLGNQAGSP